MTTPMRTTRNLSIASTVFSVLGIITSIFAFFSLMAVLPQILNGVDYSYSINNGMNGYYDYGYGTYGDNSQYSQLIAGASMLVVVVIFSFVMLMHILMLVAGIIGIKNAEKPGKEKMVFGWSLAGAILSFLCGSLIACILFIIQTVYANKSRKYAAGPAPAEQIPVNPYVAPASPYAAPYDANANYAAPASDANWQTAQPYQPVYQPVPEQPVYQPVPEQPVYQPEPVYQPAPAPEAAPVAEPVQQAEEAQPASTQQEQ